MTPHVTAQENTSGDDQNLHKAVEYLRNAAYNPDLHLCPEAPRVAPNVYWVASNNLLAFKALERLRAFCDDKVRTC
jgi:hypothetical protein